MVSPAPTRGKTAWPYRMSQKATIHSIRGERESSKLGSNGGRTGQSLCSRKAAHQIDRTFR